MDRLYGGVITNGARSQPTAEGFQEGAPQNPSKLPRAGALVQAKLPQDVSAGPTKLHPDTTMWACQWNVNNGGGGGECRDTQREVGARKGKGGSGRPLDFPAEKAQP